jgi:PAS domain-containing protein
MSRDATTGRLGIADPGVANSGLQRERLLELLSRTLKARSAHLCFYDGATIRVLVSVGESITPDMLLAYPCRFDAGDPDPLVISDLCADPRYASTPLATGPQGIRQLVAAPLLTKENAPFGFVCLTGAEPCEISDDNLRLIEVFAGAISKEILRDSSIGIPASLALDSHSEAPPSSWVTRHSLDGSLIEATGDFEKLTGFTAGEMLRMKLEDLVSPDDKERVRQIVLEQYGGGASRRHAIVLRNKDGNADEQKLVRLKTQELCWLA